MTTPEPNGKPSVADELAVPDATGVTRGLDPKGTNRPGGTTGGYLPTAWVIDDGGNFHARA